jgi:tetratricopeptide (TPR) repeat protein
MMAVALWCVTLWSPVARGARQDQQKPTYTMPEYNALQQANGEKDLNQKVRLLDDFVSKFPNSALLPYVYQAYWETYTQLKNYPKVIEYSNKYLGVNDKQLSALGLTDKQILENRLQAALAHASVLESAYNPKDPNTKDYLTKGRDDAVLGLKLLDQLPKPDNMTDAQFADQVKKPVAAVLNGAAGFATLQLKDYKAAADFYHAIVTVVPTDTVSYYRLGVAQLFEDPPQTMDGLWSLARAAAMKGPVQAAARDYLKKRIVIYEQPTCDSLADAQVNEMIQLAAGSPDRPATYTIPSRADLDKVVQASNILTVLTDLKAGGDKGKMTWLAICGAVFPEVGGKIIDVKPGTDSVELLLFTGATDEEMQAATTANMDVKVVGQPEASRLQKDDGARFSGTLSSYDPDPAFMLHWDSAKVNAEDIPAEKAAPGKHTPHKVPPKKPN